jgi:thymidylate synthase
MKISVIEARDLSEAWFLCLRQTLDEGYEYKIDRGSYAGQKRKELDIIVIQVRYPGTRPLIPDVPQGVPPPSTMEYVESYLPYLMTSHKKKGEEYTYGQYLERQIAEVIRMYREDGYNTNQAYMRMIDTRIRDGRLNFVVYFRSWDLWAGFPSNLAAIQLLKEYMSSEIGVKDGELVAMSKGLHLYEYTWELAKNVVRVE